MSRDLETFHQLLLAHGFRDLDQPYAPNSGDAVIAVLTASLRSLADLYGGRLQIVLFDEWPSPLTNSSTLSAGRHFTIFPQYPTLLLSTSPPPHDQQLPPHWVADHIGTVQDLFASPDHIRRYIIDNFAPSCLSPYQETNDVEERMFFGRLNLLRRISESELNWTLVGARHMGKTCFARALCRQLNAQAAGRQLLAKEDERYSHSACYLDLNSLLSSSHDSLVQNDFWRAILKSMQLEERDLQPGSRLRTSLQAAARDDLGRRHVEDRTWFEVLQRLLMYKYTRARFVLDECDAIVARDAAAGYPLFRALQSLVDEPRAQTRVLLIGYEGLYRALHSDSFPLHRPRVDSITLPPLSQEETAQLVTEPMISIGLRIENPEECVRRLQQATGGIPILVQHACRLLVARPDVNADRYVTAERLRDTLDTSVFRESIEFQFRQVENKCARTLAYATCSQSEIMHASVVASLRALGIGIPPDLEIDTLLEELALYGVLVPSKRGGSYHFASESLRQKIAARIQGLGGEPELRRLVRGCFGADSE